MEKCSVGPVGHIEPSDERASNQSMASVFLLQALRHQLCGPGGLDALEYGFLRAFGISGFERALVAFVELTQTLSCSCRRPLNLNAVPATDLTHDEEMLAGCLHCLHEGDRTRSRLMIEWIVHPGAQEATYSALAQFASLLREHMWSPAMVEKVHLPDPSPKTVQGRDALSSLVFSDLTDVERTIVLAARLWVQEHKMKGKQGRKGSSARVAEYLKANGLEGASHSLTGILYNISVAARRPVFILCPTSDGLSNDEMTLLTAISCYQLEKVEAAQSMLAKYMSPAAAGLTLGPIGGLADFLLRQTIELPCRWPNPANDGGGRAWMRLH